MELNPHSHMLAEGMSSDVAGNFGRTGLSKAFLDEGGGSNGLWSTMVNLKGLKRLEIDQKKYQRV